MLLFANSFLEYLLLFRFVWVRGTLGSGKTLVSVAIMDHLFRLGMVKGVVSNFPTVFPPYVGRDDGMVLDRGVIFDEAWTMLDARNSFVNDTKSYGAFARKFRSYWIFPSVFQVDKRMRTLIVQRSGTLPFQKGWVYRWWVDLDYDNDFPIEGWFVLWNPQRYFGMYDTGYVPVDDGGIELRHLRTEMYLTDGKGAATGQQMRDYLEQLAKLELGFEFS